jgi:hypothetical protein
VFVYKEISLEISVQILKYFCHFKEVDNHMQVHIWAPMSLQKFISL